MCCYFIRVLSIQLQSRTVSIQSKIMCHSKCTVFFHVLFTADIIVINFYGGVPDTAASAFSHPMTWGSEGQFPARMSKDAYQQTHHATGLRRPVARNSSLHHKLGTSVSPVGIASAFHIASRIALFAVLIFPSGKHHTSLRETPHISVLSICSHCSYFEPVQTTYNTCCVYLVQHVVHKWRKLSAISYLSIDLRSLFGHF